MDSAIFLSPISFGEETAKHLFISLLSKKLQHISFIFEFSLSNK